MPTSFAFDCFALDLAFGLAFDLQVFPGVTWARGPVVASVTTAAWRETKFRIMDENQIVDWEQKMKPNGHYKQDNSSIDNVQDHILYAYLVGLRVRGVFWSLLGCV